MTHPQDIPADELEDLQNLLRLKNYEQPPEGYFDDFLDEFHSRQRSAAVSGANESFFSKLNGWFQDLGAAKWAIGAGMAYAVLALAFFGSNFFGDLGGPNTGIAKDTKELLPDDRNLQHVELEKETADNPGREAVEEELEALPREF